VRSVQTVGDALRYWSAAADPCSGSRLCSPPTLVLRRVFATTRNTCLRCRTCTSREPRTNERHYARALGGGGDRGTRRLSAGGGEGVIAPTSAPTSAPVPVFNPPAPSCSNLRFAPTPAPIPVPVPSVPAPPREGSRAAPPPPPSGYTTHENFPDASGLVHASAHAARQLSSASSAAALLVARSHAARHPLGV